MSQPSLASIDIPRDSSVTPSNASQNPQTGRPPMWTNSSQRQMTGLYLYTTLPLNKILELINHSATTASPGHDSANKKLNALLDKEPRWLHPRSVFDMGQRLHQLSQSAAAPNLNMEDSAIPTAHSYSASDPSPGGIRVHVKQESDAQPSFPFSQDPLGTFTPTGKLESASAGFQMWTNMDSKAAVYIEEAMSHPDVGSDSRDLMPFLRASTVTSMSTEKSNGSVHRILRGYTEPYVKAVKRLMKKLATYRRNMRLTPHPDGPVNILRSLGDEGAAPEFTTLPFPLPGDFLSLDMQQRLNRCREHPTEHAQRRCMCAPTREIWTSPFTSSLGLSTHAEQLLSGDWDAEHLSMRDKFGNTALHFVAARGNIEQLFNIIRSPASESILNEANSCGQTFLHLVQRSVTRRTDQLCELVKYLSSTGFDVYACDYYGRNIVHILQQDGATPSSLQSVMDACGPSLPNSRDAFGHVPLAALMQRPRPLLKSILPYWSKENPEYWNSKYPENQTRDTFPTRSPSDILASASSSSSQANTSQPQNLDIEKAKALLNTVNWAMHYPGVEDEKGRNALHCLALANLSLWNPPSAEPAATRPRRKRKLSDIGSDSSTDRMEIRLSLVSRLLDYGVNPNHYDNDGNTPLITFAAALPEDGDYKVGPAIIEALILGGANIHSRNRRGETALHVAARCGRKLAVRTLVMNGANVHARDSAGRSVLEVVDAKIDLVQRDENASFARLEACRAWLSGANGGAVQNPSVIDEWRKR